MEKIICTYYKDTDGMYRWDYMAEHTKLEIYIHKWRVPDPYPLRISVEIFNRAEFSQSIYPLGRKEVNATHNYATNLLPQR